MKKIAYCYLVLTLGFFIGGCKNTNMNNLELNRFEEEIRDFDRENQYRGAPTGAVVFLGGAQIREWESMKTDFEGMPVINRGFGEATFREIIHYYRRLLDPFQAELIVINAGENDIVLGASPEEVLKSFNDFVQQIVISNRASRLVYISMVPSPAHFDYWPEFQRANELIKGVAGANPRIEFLDISREFLDADGAPIAQLYKEDGLSLNSTGYARLASALAPVLSRMF